VLKFRINLERTSEDEDYPKGPVFHRWLPNGYEDAIELKTTEPSASLKVWFERFGIMSKYSDGDCIEYEYRKKDFDPTLIPKQSSLVAGPLFGRLEFDISDEQVTLLRRNEIMNENYIKLGKKVIGLLAPPTSKFINVLRINFGQYWIKEMEEFDFRANKSASRGCSLAGYCSFMGLKWSLDGEDWKPFEPGEKIIGTLRAVKLDQKKYMQLLTREDWKNISEVTYGEEYPVALDTFMEFVEFLDKGLLNQAIINGITSLEVAINSFIRSGLQGSSREAFGDVKKEGLKQKIIILGAGLQLSPTDIEGILQVYDWRNDLVHEGLPPEIDVFQKKAKLEIVKKIIALLLGNKFKFPSLTYAKENIHVLSEDKWQY
jgi:hypothetical protein